MDPTGKAAALARAHDATRAALALVGGVTTAERALIEALPTRYPQRDPIDDQHSWNDAFADAMRMHNFQIEEQVKHLMAEGPKPLPNAPVGTLPPYNLPPKPVQPMRRSASPVQRSADGDDWLAERIESASSGGQTLEPQAQARLEAGLGDSLDDVRVHTDSEAARRRLMFSPIVAIMLVSSPCTSRAEPGNGDAATLARSPPLSLLVKSMAGRGLLGGGVERSGRVGGCQALARAKPIRLSTLRTESKYSSSLC